jgi:hypothetical protein
MVWALRGKEKSPPPLDRSKVFSTEDYIASNSRTVMNDELEERLWKEMIMLKLGSICLRGLRKTIKGIH